MPAEPIELFHEVHGPATGPPFVVLHGFPLDHRMWRAQVDPLVRAGHRLVLPDLRGHGRSPAPDVPATMERCAADLAALLDRLRMERVLLGGFSLGGYVALEFIRRHPSRVAALLLADTRAEPDTDEARRGREATADEVRRHGLGVVEERMVPKLLTARSRAQKPELEREVRAMIRAATVPGVANALLGMAERPDQRPHLGAIRAPTLVVVGEQDELTPPASAEALARGIAGARLLRIPDAAHLSPLEDPHAFNAGLEAWLRAAAPAVP